LAALERIAFRTTYFVSLLKYRFAGAMTEAFAQDPASKDPTFVDLRPLNFLMTPGLWLGLAFAGACLAAAVRLRRNREPI
jgi:hypothetical protein